MIYINIQKLFTPVFNHDFRFGFLRRYKLTKSIIFITLLIVTQYSVAATENIDPISDKNITCKEMHRYPQKIFSKFDIDLGSGHGSPIEVDYECHDGLASLPFLKHIYRLTEVIRSEGPRSCTGSIVHAHWRYYHFDLLLAGLAPNILLKPEMQLGNTNKLQAYFEYWASQSPSNYNQYKAFLTERKKAQPLLTKYYQQRFGFTHKKANAIATKALLLFTNHAAGSYPESSRYSDEPPKKLSQAAQLLKFKNPDMALLKNILATHSPEEEIDQALKTALLKHQSKDLIVLLISHLKTVNHGDESALFFALDNQKNVELLLSKGAAVDYENGFGKTPLFYAVENSNYLMANFLISHGANPNHAYKSAAELKENTECIYDIQHAKRTLLMHAAQHSDIKMLKLLIQHGARLQEVDELGFNALDYAIHSHKASNIIFLQSLGAKPNITKNYAFELKRNL